MLTPVIPALDLIGGAVVRLHQGDYHQTTRYDRDPAALIAAYREQGAQQIHLVDLDGAKDPAQRQTALIARLAASARCPLQTGGGIRSADDIAALLDAGANRVVIGSLAVEQPDTVKAWLARFGGERIVLALDVRPHDGAHYLAVRGWQDTSAHTATAACATSSAPTSARTAPCKARTPRSTVSCTAPGRSLPSRPPAASAALTTSAP